MPGTQNSGEKETNRTSGLSPCLHVLILKFNSSLSSLLQDLEVMRRKLESLGDNRSLAFVLGSPHAFECLQASTARILLEEASPRLPCLLLPC